MNNKDYMMSVMRDYGRRDALALRERAKDMEPTAIIEEVMKVPDFDGKRDYTNCPVGTPVKDQGCVFSLLQPHNAANYGGTPMTLRALWSLCHTKNPDKAVEWVEPQGTSGMYMKGESYKETDGAVYQSTMDNNVWKAPDYPQGWKLVREAPVEETTGEVAE